MSIGTDLKTARKVLALSRHALAKMVNIDPRHLGNIENSGRLLVFPAGVVLEFVNVLIMIMKKSHFVRVCERPINKETIL